MMNVLKYSLLLSAFMLMASCGGNKKAASDADMAAQQPVGPSFNADSAYAYCKAQCDFGPRTMNSEAHDKCGEWIMGKFRQYGLTVIPQNVKLTGFDGTPLRCTNIVASYRPELTTRILLCAHWDSRPWADNDPDSANWRKPVMGANDGASGVGVLLEIARQIQQQAPQVGIDLIFFDSEDYGTPDFYEGTYKPDTWCLGSQYWGRIPHVPDYKARFGILLDMVGGKNATFYYEAFSKQTANNAMKKIWKMADHLGYSNYFIKEDGGQVTDDHVYVNQYRQIPCVDIIHYDTQSNTGFNPTWHTLDDSLENIDKATLQAVGQTVMGVIYNEK